MAQYVSIKRPESACTPLILYHQMSKDITQSSLAVGTIQQQTGYCAFNTFAGSQIVQACTLSSLLEQHLKAMPACMLKQSPIDTQPVYLGALMTSIYCKQADCA